MASDLENRLDEQQPTLKEELSQSIKAYPQTWKHYFKKLLPAMIVSSAGSALGQWAANRLGYDSNTAMTAAAYLCGYIPGYSTFFGLEYLKNKQNYQDGIFGRNFTGFVGTFLAADYVADISTFTPAFIASNVWLANNTELHPAIRSLVAWNGAGLLYTSSISALHPLIRRVTGTLNNGIKRTWKKLKTGKQQ